MGYANAVARYLANLFGGAPSNQKPQNKNNENGPVQSNPTANVRKRASINRSGSSFGTASQGDATSNGDKPGVQKPLKKKPFLSRSQSRQEGGTATPPPPPKQVSANPNTTPTSINPNTNTTFGVAVGHEGGLKESIYEDRVVLKNKLDHREQISLKIFQNFDLRYVKFLGAGGQGEVHQVLDLNTNVHYALKIIKQNSAAKKYEKEALEVIKGNGHFGIIKLEACIEDEDFLYLLTHFVEGLTVRDIIPYMEQFTWERKREFVIPLLAELCLAIDFLHQLGYVHRDIKASNCFLDMFGHVTIGDFGSCIQKGLIKARVIFGTVPYTISPEMFYKVAYGVEADYWGIGVLACELLLGFFPFDWFTRDEIKSKETVNEVINTIKSPQIPEDTPEDVQQVLYAFLTADPKRRLGSPAQGGIESIEKHPFFAGIHWERFRNPTNRSRSLPVLKLMKAIQKKKAAKAEQAAAAAAAAAMQPPGLVNESAANFVSNQNAKIVDSAGNGNQRQASYYQSGGDTGDINGR